MSKEFSFVPLTYEDFKSSVIQKNMISKNDCIVAAVSGGCDSSAMLHLLKKLSEEIDFSLICAHVNHNIRGEEAKRDEDYVRNTCLQYGIPFRLLSIDILDYARKNHLSTEDAGRKARYDFFNSLSEEFGEIKIATAHTLSDSAETFIYNVARGCSVTGLCGIPAFRDNIIRPLIDFTRDQTEDYCWQNDIEFVTDSTNLTDEYTRNKIRHSVIPVLKGINPSFEKAFSRLESNLGNIRNYISKNADELLLKATSKNGIDCKVFKEAPSFVQNEIAAKILKKFGLEVTNERVNYLADSFNNRLSFKNELSKNVFLVKKEDLLFCEISSESLPDLTETPFSCGEITISPCKTIKTEILSKADFDNSYKVKKINLKQTFDYDKIIGSAIIRSRKTGDCADIHGGTKTLKKLFIEEKIPAEIRNQVAVIADQDGIVWIEGLGTNKRCRVTNLTKTVAVIYSSEIYKKSAEENKDEV